MLTRRRVLFVLSSLAGASLLILWLITPPQPTLTYSVPVTIGDQPRPITIEAFLPATTKQQVRHPAIILLHGIEGPQRARSQRYRTADGLRDAGYAVFIVHYFNSVDYKDLYHLLPDNTLDHARIQRHMNADSAKWIAATAGAIQKIAERDDVDPDRMALNGYSLGGFIAISATQASISDPAIPDVKCLVVNWGAMFHNAQFSRGYPPTLFVHGEKDEVVELKFAQQTIAALRQVETDTCLCVVPGAGHLASSAESQRLTRKLLAKHLAP